eukprot:5488989-Prymnesium_polylepis.1
MNQSRPCHKGPWTMLHRITHRGHSSCQGSSSNGNKATERKPKSERSESHSPRVRAMHRTTHATRVPLSRRPYVVAPIWGLACVLVPV